MRAPRHKNLKSKVSPETQWTDQEDAAIEYAIDHAVSCVMQHFDALIEALDPDSRELIRDYFSGKTVQQLSKEKKVSEKAMKGWVDGVCRQLGQDLRHSRPVKQ